MNDTHPVKLTELEKDALTELVNLGVSNAALSLREMVREEVLLLIVWWSANINSAGGPVVVASVTEGLFEVFEIFAHPRFITVAEVDQRGATLAEILMVIVH